MYIIKDQRSIGKGKINGQPKKIKVKDKVKAVFAAGAMFGDIGSSIFARGPNF